MRVDQYQGADASGLEEKIKQHVENDPGSNEDSDIPKGYVSLHSGPFTAKLQWVVLAWCTGLCEQKVIYINWGC